MFEKKNGKEKKMNRLVCLLILLFLFLSSFSLLAVESKIKILSKKPLGSFQLPPVSIETLPNGIKIYLLENHELPIVEMFSLTKGGALNDPPNKIGLASLVGAVLRTGGTTQHSIEQIDKALENRGASLETGAANEYETAVLRCLSKDKTDLIPLFFEILSSPRFDEGKLKLAIEARVEGLKRQNDDPEKIAVREYPKLIYGNSSAWGRVATAKTLRSVTQKDLFEFHSNAYQPNQTILAISGDFKKEEMIALIKKSTEEWKNKKTNFANISPLQKEFKGGIYGIDKKIAQTTILMGHFGEKRFNPDKFALILMNYMLGGDIFFSRLGEEVRSNRGLAYTIFSSFGLESDYGIFYVLAQTQKAATGEVIGLIEKEIRTFHDGKDFSENSLQIAKEAILNQRVGDWEPAFNYLKERARLSFYGYPENYLDVYTSSLNAVTLEQVRQVAKKYLDPDHLKILVVGDLQVIAPQLKSWGELQKIPLAE